MWGCADDRRPPRRRGPGRGHLPRTARGAAAQRRGHRAGVNQVLCVPLHRMARDAAGDASASASASSVQHVHFGGEPLDLAAAVSSWRRPSPGDPVHEPSWDHRDDDPRRPIAEVTDGAPAAGGVDQAATSRPAGRLGDRPAGRARREPADGEPGEIHIAGPGVARLPELRLELTAQFVELGGRCHWPAAVTSAGALPGGSLEFCKGRRADQAARVPHRVGARSRAVLRAQVLGVDLAVLLVEAGPAKAWIVACYTAAEPTSRTRARRALADGAACAHGAGPLRPGGPP